MGKYMVFSAWPYINSEPHLGTLLHLISADYYARFLRIMGEDVVSVSGSDEHGTPIEVEAIKQGKNPKDLTDEMHSRVLEILRSFSVELDNYTRTENEVHKEFVRDFYLQLEKNGYVFKQTTVQLYCEKDRIFLPDRFVIGRCPYCGYERARGDQCENCGRLLEPTLLVEPRCAICGERPVRKETFHWFFDLPKLTEEITRYVETLDENVKGYLKNMLEEGLRPRSITRDNKWGIPAPFAGSEGKTIYVWMEAVLGYLSGVIELERKKGERLFEKFWMDPDTKSVYFIGKDNIPFHAIILPALLIASRKGYNLPKKISSTEFILFGQMKFSKSQHVGVWASDALGIADGEYWRYVILSLRPERGDTSFSWQEFDKLVNSDLNDKVGNYAHRVLTFVKDRFGGSVPENLKPSEEDRAFSEAIMKLEEEFIRLNYDLRIKDAARKFVDASELGNQYFSSQQPWSLYKSDKERASSILYTSVQSLAHIAFMMYPVAPKRSQKLASMLGITSIEKPKGWEIIRPGTKIERVEPLFQKINLKY
ncbi:MAG: methionine--tRNA ligase [Nitrososphaeria archaeon]